MNKNILSITAIAIFCSLTSFTLAQTISTAGLLSHYPFSGSANDNVGTNHGVVLGATLTTDRFGNPNSAYYFNGVNNYIKISNTSNLNNTDFTYNWWVQGYSYADFSASNILEIGSQEFTGGRYGQIFSINRNYNGTTGWRVTSGNTNATTIGFQNGVLPETNKWYNVTVTRNDSIVRLYVDCQLVESAVTNDLTPYYSNPLNIFIGSRAQLDLDQYFHGKIDDIRIYNRALSQAEINTFCNEGICYQYVSVTDTLIINTGITGFNPVTYQSAIKVYPNPTHDHLTIDYGDITLLNNYQIKIINSLGQVMYESAITQPISSINLAAWTGNGTYFLHLIDGQGNIEEIKKIILQ